MSTLLIYAVGHTDVQLIDDGERRELEKKRSKELHAELAGRSHDWQLEDSPARRHREPVPSKDRREASLFPPGKIHLCTPKLDALLSHLGAAAAPVPSISHALILHTDRQQQGDPTQAGPVVTRRLKERTGVMANLVSFLSGQERLENPGEPRDAILRRDLVALLERTIAEAIASSGAAHVVVAVSGGFPEVGSLVRELVHLHADVHVLELEVPEPPKGSEAADLANERRAHTDPSQVVAAKRHALTLVEQGSFIAAWGAVAHLHDEPTCQLWTRAIHWLYQWASSLPFDESEQECDLPFPSRDQRAANTAMRVELALRCADVPRAVQGSVSFFEAAVWDHLYARHIEEQAERTNNDRAQFRVTPDPEEKQAIAAVPATDSQGRKLYTINNYGKDSRSIAKDYLRRHGPAETAALLKLEDKIPKALHLRNLVAHGEPRPDRIKHAQTEMEKLQLWSTSAPPRFLSQPLIRDVLAELKVDAPEALCDRLIAEVRRRLRGISSGGAR